MRTACWLWRLYINCMCTCSRSQLRFVAGAKYAEKGRISVRYYTTDMTFKCVDRQSTDANCVSSFYVNHRFLTDCLSVFVIQRQLIDQLHGNTQTQTFKFMYLLKEPGILNMTDSKNSASKRLPLYDIVDLWLCEVFCTQFVCVRSCLSRMSDVLLRRRSSTTDCCMRSKLCSYAGCQWPRYIINRYCDIAAQH
jgi:hypothetical protein